MLRVSGYLCRSDALVRRLHAHGFTLLEVLIVIAIIVVLFATSFGAIRGAKERAAIVRAKSELTVLTNALEEFKRHYGDYPQAGPSASGRAHLVLFNALTGMYGPRGLDGPRLRGPMLVELSKLTLEHPLPEATPAPAEAGARPAMDNAFVDPWGARYFYFHKSGGADAPWRAAHPVLFSAGPDGRVSAEPGAAGIFAADAQVSGDNADNIYAEKLQ